MMTGHGTILFQPKTDLQLTHHPGQTRFYACRGFTQVNMGVLECCTVLYCTVLNRTSTVLSCWSQPLSGGSRIFSTWRGWPTESGKGVGVGLSKTGRLRSDWGDRVRIWRRLILGRGWEFCTNQSMEYCYGVVLWRSQGEGGYCAFMIFMGFFAFIILLPMSGAGWLPSGVY